MKTWEYKVFFNTPAFLGNAEQQGQWRTPPFKALIRQWWRVAYAEAHRYPQSTVAMRHEEGLLFGHAWLESDRDEQGRPVASRKSAVRIRLGMWDIGKLKNWDGPDQTVHHPEVKNRQGQAVPVGSNLYLGYGPLIFRNGTSLKANAAIQAGEQATLSIAYPTTHRNADFQRLLEANSPRLEQALYLMDRYGTLGGRSSNGWGSFAMRPLPPGETRDEGTTLTGATPLRPWREALTLDWPHALGQDEKGALIWQTRPFDNWKALMRELAVVKIGLRTQFVFTTGKNADHPDARHWLSYPVTNHNVAAWKERGRGDFRLPNSLRFKVRKTAEGQLVGVVFHVPCLSPPAFNPKPNRQAIEQVWSQVHRYLDEPTQQLTRIGE